MKRKPKVTPTKPNPNKPTMPDLPPAAQFPVTERTIADLPLADQQRIMGYKKPFEEKYLATIATQTRQGKQGKRSIKSGGEAR